MSKIVLGTANFGKEYGIANQGKLISKKEVESTINWAQDNGINHFDTALSYENAEEVLGKYLDLSLEPAIDTKLNVESCQSRTSIVKAAKKTRDRIGVKSLSTLYLHDGNLLQTSGKNEISLGLCDVLDLGIAKQIGVSVYSEEAVKNCKQALPELTVFQVPENICDRRLKTSRLIHSLARDGNSFRIRSIFLQGLLVMEPTSIPPELRQATSQVLSLNEFASMKSITTIDLCLAYANSISWVDAIVVGVASLKQLKEIHKSDFALPDGWDAAIGVLPPEIVDPRKWPK